MKNIKPIRFRISQADIDNGCQYSTTNNPVVLAVGRYLKPRHFCKATCVELWVFNDSQLEPVGIAALPTQLQAFMRKFDAGKTVAPGEYQLSLPTELLAG